MTKRKKTKKRQSKKRATKKRATKKRVAKKKSVKRAAPTASATVNDEKAAVELPKKSSISRNIKSAAMEAKVRKEQASWLEEQAEALSDASDAVEILEEFDKTLTRGMFDQNSLDVMMTHGTIESLEKMYGEAQADLLKAKRKAMVLEMIVNKAHDLLGEQALAFLTK